VNNDSIPFHSAIQDFIGAETIEDLINLMENRRMLQNFRKTNQGNLNADAAPEKDPGPTAQSLTVDSRAIKLYTTKYMETKHQRDAAQ